jgi:hypothetical protein
MYHHQDGEKNILIATSRVTGATGTWQLTQQVQTHSLRTPVPAVVGAHGRAPLPDAVMAIPTGP